ncbi:hypothetical protein [Nonomuraea africana]|uniref:PIN domain-containing protein n=1 Tax=Nonomuraea africana TaxID=46171 RepID=A0ABR9KCN2_9ACTN|nr:hypothetical protein [Nonomuraea africana]MBE1559772.1 hypothetical protein [Nonomuraea africana]
MLDTSALIAWGRRSSPYVDATIWMRAEHRGYIVPIVTTAPALTAALAQLPDSAVPVLEVLLGMDGTTLVDSLIPASAPGVAEVLRIAGPYATEQVTAASVVHAAKRRSLPVVTANPFPLTALWSDIEIDQIP